MRNAIFGFLLAGLALSSLGGCSADAGSSDPNIDDPSMTGSDAVTTCKRRIYVHVISYGSTNYAAMLADKNGCWGLEAPKWSGGAQWEDCNATKATPSGGARWSYDDVNIGAAGHSDAAKIKDCKAKNGGKPDVAYVAANSGTQFSHFGITGVERFFNECYDTDFAVKNRTSGCTTNGIPMWNIGASSNAYADTLALCKSRSSGDWMGIYAASVGLKGKEAEIVKALNYCTTH
ncbi:MAG: hypothetical protein ACRELY_13315 [Polyangiaceae bacterium]